MPHDVKFDAIVGFTLVTADPGRLAAFYRAIGFDVGDAEPIPDADMRLLDLQGAGFRTAISLGKSRIDLEAFEQAGRPYPSDTTACDRVFQHLALVTDDANAAWCRARDAGAMPISKYGPVTLPAAAGGVTAVKLRDPDGHPLEFLQFPPGAGTGWSGKGIIGIDHSAISVGDVEASKRFYTHHGLHVGHATLNHGPTQEALDGLGGRGGVNVDVVPMLPADAPPHVELLGYRHPAGRASPPLASNDIAATRIVWQSDDDALIRDPDGHFHQLSQRDRSPEDTASRR